MTDRNSIESFRLTSQGLSVEAQRLLQNLWRRLDPKNPDATRNALLKALPDVITTYGEAGASVAADYYDGLRADAALDGFVAEAAPPAKIAQQNASIRWAVGPLFDPEHPAASAVTLSNLAQVVDRLVKQPGRMTIIGASRRDPSKPKFARSPTGAFTCLFCATMASRGAVYSSRETAGEFRRFHAHCDCVVAPIFEGMPLPDGYDPEHFFRIYQENGGASINFSTGSRNPSKPLPSPSPTKSLDAFEKLAAPETMTEAMQRVNPFYSITGEGDGYRINCQACTAATEMRARGLNVEAVKNTAENAAFGSDARILGHWRTEHGYAPTPSHAKTFADMKSEAESWPIGSRGFVTISWKDGGRHIFNVERTSDGLKWLDGQPGVNKGEEWADRVDWSGRSGDNWLLRSDNLKPAPSLAGYLKAPGIGDTRTMAEIRAKHEQVLAVAKKRGSINDLNSRILAAMERRDRYAKGTPGWTTFDNMMKRLEIELDKLLA